MPAETAVREAVRGTYDPTYGGYFLGKMAAFKLWRDYQVARGKDFNLREFHERVKLLRPRRSGGEPRRFCIRLLHIAAVSN